MSAAYLDGIQPWHAKDREQAPMNFNTSLYPEHDYPLLTPQIRYVYVRHTHTHAYTCI